MKTTNIYFTTEELKKIMEKNIKSCNGMISNCINDLYIYERKYNSMQLTCPECFYEQTFILNTDQKINFDCLYLNGYTIISEKQYEKLYSLKLTKNFLPREKASTIFSSIKFKYRTKSLKEIKDELDILALCTQKDGIKHRYELKLFYLKKLNKSNNK